jgi:hypothetical protein
MIITDCFSTSLEVTVSTELQPFSLLGDQLDKRIQVSTLVRGMCFETKSVRLGFLNAKVKFKIANCSSLWLQSSQVAWVPLNFLNLLCQWVAERRGWPREGRVAEESWWPREAGGRGKRVAKGSGWP